MAEITQKVLWMRNIDFRILKDLLYFISLNNGVFRPIALEKNALDNGIFIKDGKVLNHTSRFNYRKTLENLELAVLVDGHYWVAHNDLVLKLLANITPDKDLSDTAKTILKEIIITNKDCKRFFFDIFINEENYGINELQLNSSYAIASLEEMMKSKKEKSFRKIVLRGNSGKTIVLDSVDKIQAIFWGIRHWALNLGIINEVFIDAQEGRIMYIINNNCTELFILNKLIQEIEIKAQNESVWVSVHIPTFIKKIIQNQDGRASVDFIKKCLLKIVDANASVMFYEPTSSSLIESKIPFEKQDEAFRQCFLHVKTVGYISHIRINKKFGGFLL